jgi:hypothetical protein
MPAGGRLPARGSRPAAPFGTGVTPYPMRRIRPAAAPGRGREAVVALVLASTAVSAATSSAVGSPRTTHRTGGPFTAECSRASWAAASRACCAACAAT